MRVLMVCMSDPKDGRKGDTKLVRKRQIVLEEMGCIVDILYFRWTIQRASIEVKSSEGRKGVDIVANVSVWGLVAWLTSKRWVIKTKPIQTWLSFALAGSCRSSMAAIFSSYAVVHFVHIRSVGLWVLAAKDTRVIADLIDSYTLNIGNWIKTETRWWVKWLLREEYKRIFCMEANIEDYFSNRLKSTVVTVANEDLEHIGGETVRKIVIPVGIDIKCLGKRARGDGELRCVFFGNLDYRPNIDACRVIIEVARELRLRRLNNVITITVAGRNVGRSLKRMLLEQGIEVLSPVESMYQLVKGKDVAVLPMVSGSGMQSKVLEAISWGVLVMATPRTAKPLGLVSCEEYIEIRSAEDIVRCLVNVADGLYEVDSVRRKAHKRIEAFGWEKTCVKLMGEYTQ